MYFVPPSKRSCCNYFRLSQSREAKKLITVSLGTEHFLKVNLLAQDPATQEGFTELKYAKNHSHKFAMFMRSAHAWTVVKGRKKNHFPSLCGCVCLFSCSSMRRPSHCLHWCSAVSRLALLLQRLPQLPVGDWSAARPRSQDTLWQVCDLQFEGWHSGSCELYLTDTKSKTR